MDIGWIHCMSWVGSDVFWHKRSDPTQLIQWSSLYPSLNTRSLFSPLQHSLQGAEQRSGYSEMDIGRITVWVGLVLTFCAKNWPKNRESTTNVMVSYQPGDIVSVSHVRYDTIRYDTIRWTILTCAQKLTISQLNLPHGTKQKRIMKKRKTEKNGDAQKKRSGREVRGVSPEAGRESMVGKICVRCRRKKFTFAISSPDEFLYYVERRA